MIFGALPGRGIDKMAAGTKSREIGRMEGSVFGLPKAG
jgi:hypothetical protein